MSQSARQDEGSSALQVNSPVLQRLLEREGSTLLPAFEARPFAPGEALCAFGEPPAGLFIVLSGEVSISRRSTGTSFLPVEMLRAGDVLGGVLDAESQPVLMEARAVTPTATLFLSRARIVELGRRVPELLSVLRALAEIQAVKRRFVAAMRRAGAFRSASPRQLARLLDSAEGVDAPAGATLVRRGDPPSGFYFVVDGDMGSTVLDGAVHPLGTDDLFGDQAMVLGEEPATVVAVRPSRLLKVPADRYERQLAVSSSFRRRLGRGRRLGGPPSSVRFDRSLGNTVEVLLVQSDVPGAPLGVLTDLLARSMASDHGDEVAIIELTAGGSPAGGVTPDPEIPSLVRLRAPALDGPAAVQAVDDALASLGDAYDRVFIDASGASPAIAAALAPILSERQGKQVAGRPVARGKVVFLSRDPLAQRLPEPLRAVRVASAALIGGPARAQGADLLWERAYPAATTRVRLDLDRIASLRRPEDRRLDALPAAERATFSRWARAITDRTVGIALGGGGAWGFAHVTLFRKIHEAGVPIDMVSGSSFGALAGAFYCAAGLQGLDLLMRLGAEANRAIAASFFASSALGRFVDDALGGLQLEDLEVPLFPVATDLATGVERVAGIGTLGAGVRASGAFPGMFTPVIDGGAYCVDGGFINNVPASVLVNEGADLVIASNIVALPPPMALPEMLPDARIRRWLHEFNPVARLLDLMRAGFVLMHTTGERESDLADVVFTSDPIHLESRERRGVRDWIFGGKVPFWDFTVGPDVAAKAEPKALAAARQIKAKWQILSRGS